MPKRRSASGSMLYAGTSGWAYKEWKEGFYPAALPQTRFLEHYTRVLTACEINATFYRLHSPQTFARWAEAAPASFRFALKGHRRLTHAKQIASTKDRDFLDRFVESFAPLGDRLGCVLLQFPPYRERDDEGLERLLSALPAGLAFALEFRHPSWEAEQVQERIALAGGTVCVSDTAGSPPAALPPGLLAYVRLRAARYGDDQRGRWLSLLEREAERRDVYAFAKHEGVPVGDPNTGAGLAQWLVEQSATEVSANSRSSRN